MAASTPAVEAIKDAVVTRDAVASRDAVVSKVGASLQCAVVRTWVLSVAAIDSKQLEAFKAKVENPKLAKVTVDGDAMTIPEIIDQLKKIVPFDKFNWEVFNFKENIFRVKLPSKQEVQRLKNFGTYICTDRESCLSFDLCSSLEEPMYTLPEVWVRVSGLPSDIRSDYLSLWGVGTLFGKTMDVDMAYTRSNKVLRTKIGCLDRNLIPTDSDVFIRRGFFKLHFEVEETNGSQEVDMAEVNNGNDGNDDAHNGEHNKEGVMPWIWIPKDQMKELPQIMMDKVVLLTTMAFKGCNCMLNIWMSLKLGLSMYNLVPQVGIWASGLPPQQCMQSAPPSTGVQHLQLTGSCNDSSKQASKCAAATCAGVQQGLQLANSCNGSSQQANVCAAVTCAGVQQGLQLADNCNGSSQQASACAAATCVSSV
ncbi:hypothetical protein ACQ4PT_015248 [Festuca glaucescens]